MSEKMPSPEELKAIQEKHMTDEEIKMSEERGATFEAAAQTITKEQMQVLKKKMIDTIKGIRNDNISKISEIIKLVGIENAKNILNDPEVKQTALDTKQSWIIDTFAENNERLDGLGKLP